MAKYNFLDHASLIRLVDYIRGGDNPNGHVREFADWEQATRTLAKELDISLTPRNLKTAIGLAGDRCRVAVSQQRASGMQGISTVWNAINGLRSSVEALEVRIKHLEDAANLDSDKGFLVR